MVTLLGTELFILFLVYDNRVLAYSIHYDERSAKEHLEKIKRFHKLKGEIVRDAQLEEKYLASIKNKIYFDITPPLDLQRYKYSKVYEELLRVKIGHAITYGELARRSGYSIWQVIQALKHNPFLILIPCHRVIKRNGDLGGYTPLGKEFKKLLLKLEGAID